MSAVKVYNNSSDTNDQVFYLLFHIPTLVISCIADMKDGFYERFESQLQGFQNTYYVGGLLAFELTERNASYSIETVCKHFAIDVEQTVTPYVKVSYKILSRYV
jgi:hypothetical protein